MTVTPSTVPTICISEPELGRDVEDLVLSVLRSGHLAQGPVVECFESLCAEMAGSRHAVAVSNGTASLEVAFEALGIGPGDEVITSPLTFAATLNAALRSGATVRFADVRSDYTIDPVSASALIGPRTAAIVPVHLYGQPADMAALRVLGVRHGLAIIEDAAQAHGAQVGDRRVGSFGVGSFSFYATKNVTAGEGGVVTTNDDALADRVRLLRNQGMRTRYSYEVIGRNLRMTDLQAAVAVPQLRRLPEITRRRAVNADVLARGLAGSSVVLPPLVAGRPSVWHQFTVLLPAGSDRDAIVGRMAAGGVQAGIYYPSLVWDHDVYRHHPEVRLDDTPVAADVTRRCLSLPVHPRLSAADAERVVAVMADALG